MTAHATSAAATAGAEGRLLLLRVAEEFILLPLADVREVVDAPALLAVPMAPQALRGQLALRGEHLPVLDAATLLGIPRASEGVPVAVILGDAGAALAVDDALDIWDAAATQAHPAPPTMGQGVLRGLRRHGDRLAGLVDMPALRALVVASLRTSLP